MPRQSRPSSRAPSRPTLAPRAPAPQQQQQQQQRPATTMAAPRNAPASTSQGPGLIGQMASTAAGVAVGSTVGNAMSGLLFGGSSSAPAAEPAAAASQTQEQQPGNNCAGATQSFTQCMDDHRGNMSICGWYLEQLKACQAAASQY